MTGSESGVAASTGTDPSRRTLLLLTLAMALAVSFSGIFVHDLWTPDEPRVA